MLQYTFAMHLTDPLEKLFLRLQPVQKQALKRLKITTVHDLLYHFPTRYELLSEIRTIATLKKNDEAILYGRIVGLETRRSWKTKKPVAEAWIEDSTGRMKIIWFHQPYIAKMLQDGMTVKLSGHVTGTEGKLYFANPEIEHAHDLPIDTHDTLFAKGDAPGTGSEETFFAMYPESQGITSKWLRHAVERVLQQNGLETIEDPIPAEILKRYNLPTLKTALIWIHTPRRAQDKDAARKRFAFEEVFAIQLSRQQMRHALMEKQALSVHVDRTHTDAFIKRFPFTPTSAQQKAIDTILTDFEKPHPMARLLEGDVGSGKTAVAASTAYAVVTTHPNKKDFGNLQVAYMVPTEILAQQHFESFISYFSHMPINIGLITSSGCKKFPSKVSPTKATDISRAQLLKWVKNGEIPILIGTHALIQKSVAFKNLAYVIIDEQHRFGTTQRQMLTRKDAIVPHLLSMTATPIPRTLALTIYGDLDLTLLDEMPAGRKPIITDIITPIGRKATYEAVRSELVAGRQAYVICPRIDEPDPQKEQALNVKSVKEEAARLQKKVFPEFRVGILHGKMTAQAKEEVMLRFKNHELDILVATSVIEVGVNVPNATIIIIEGAERFGLAQLHQLRGRVIRSNHQAYCYVFAESKSQTTLTRLKALKTAKNGFELAEHDLAIRGPGELGGRSQAGITDLGMEAIKNIKMVEAARTEAVRLVADDPTFAHYPLLASLVQTRSERLHFE